MNWVMLITAGLFEIGWTIGLKYTEGFFAAVAERRHRNCYFTEFGLTWYCHEITANKQR